MPRENIPTTIRPLITVEEGQPVPPADAPEIKNRPEEAKRVVKRISTIIEEHRHACLPLNVEIDTEALGIVFDALRDHAKGGSGTINHSEHDEIRAHCLDRLVEELAEEPSNILYATSTGPDSIRYDAMESSFWIECLDLLENNIQQNS